MAQSASQAAAFRREVAEHGQAWTIEDDGGIPAPENSEGRRAMPFWSSEARARRAIATQEGWEACRPRAISVDDLVSDWLPDLDEDGLLVGVNWTGERMTGYDVEPQDVLAWLAEV